MYVYFRKVVNGPLRLILLKELWTGNLPYSHLTEDDQVQECIENYDLPIFPDEVRPLTIHRHLLTSLCRDCWEWLDYRLDMNNIVEGFYELEVHRQSPTRVCILIVTSSKCIYLRNSVVLISDHSVYQFC